MDAGERLLAPVNPADIRLIAGRAGALHPSDRLIVRSAWMGSEVVGQTVDRASPVGRRQSEATLLRRGIEYQVYLSWQADVPDIRSTDRLTQALAASTVLVNMRAVRDLRATRAV